MPEATRYVISGLGLATPAGCDTETFWSTLEGGRDVFQEVPLFEGEERGRAVGRVSDARLRHGLTRRQIKRLDRFTLLAISATRDALASSRLAIDAQTGGKIGITLGNCTGGWGFVEPQLYALYGASDFQGINSYVATAWFPTAPQGEISILLGIGGFSKTVVAESISAGFALRQALCALADGHVEAVLVGGTEAPLTPLVYNACAAAGITSPSGAYRPFHPDADGAVLAEGAAILVVEERRRTLDRGAPIVAEIGAIGHGTSLAESLEDCLGLAGCRPGDIDYVLLDGRGTPSEDDQEYAALGTVFRGNSGLRLSAPKSVYGSALAANMAVDLVTACLALARQRVPPTIAHGGGPASPPVGTHVAGRGQPAPVDRVVVNGRDNYGQSLSVLLARPQAVAR